MTAIGYSMNQINNFTEALLKTYNLYDVPINIEKLIHLLNGEIIPTIEKDDVIKIKITNGNSFIILLPEKHNGFERRFSLAHSLGHLFLHMRFQVDDKPNYQTHIDNAFFRHSIFPLEENEANIFAECILLPKELLKPLLSKYGKVNDIANYFMVPDRVVRERIKYF